jgi:hypothetical protein
MNISEWRNASQTLNHSESKIAKDSAIAQIHDGFNVVNDEELMLMCVDIAQILRERSPSRYDALLQSMAIDRIIHSSMAPASLRNLPTQLRSDGEWPV